MVRGLFSSAAGMITQYKMIDMLAGNTANVNTAGYKQAQMTLSDFGQELARNSESGNNVGAMPYAVQLDTEYYDNSQGNTEPTGINSDLAITGDGFFAVQSPAGGAVKYTRNGNFTVDANGCLALATGEELLGDDGRPLVVGGDSFTVNPDGAVTLADGTAARITLYTNPVAQNITLGRDGFYNINGPVAATGAVLQGYQENSNTDVVGNMTAMMNATRSFQGSQQAFQVCDDALQKLVTQVGSLK